MSSSSEQYRYWAFISYSSKDAAPAKKLHKRLETYSIPRDLRGRPGRDEPVPKKLFPIFRDREELPLSADLGASIEDALQASRYLIVLCSPHSAQSRWVNEEIRYFKSLGREDRILAIILDGEPNASDNPETAAEECFPPALRHKVDETGELTDERTEPIGGDLREGGDGWTSVFLKAVAGITGLGYDAFARREQKRRRRRQMMLAAVALLALIGGLWTWDYYRVKTDYYANVATVWGVPTGVGELNAEMREGRQYHYRFEFSQRKVRRVERVNSAGTLRNDDENHGASVREVEYDEDGTLTQIDLRDHNGKLVLRKVFGDMSESPGGPVQYIDFEQEHQNAPMMMASTAGALDAGLNEGNSQKADITAHCVIYDDRGRAREITYYNAYRVNRANANGVFGQRLTYGESLLPIRIENLGFSECKGAAEPIPDKNGIVTVERIYDDQGDALSLRYLGSEGTPTLNSNGVAQVAFDRDPFGNTVQGRVFGLNGEPTFHQKGYHRWTSIYDERGHLVEESYFGAKGRPVLYDGADIHRLIQAFDEHGNSIEQAYFGTEGKPILHQRLGAFRITRTYDERGNVVEQAYFGTGGKPILGRYGYHKEVASYDKRGNQIGAAYFGIDEEPVLGEIRDVHCIRRTYDERGNVVEQTYFGIDGKPAMDDDDVHRVEKAYDERSNLREEAYFGADGAPVLNAYDFHRRIWTYDDRGNRVGVAHFGLNGEPVLRGGKNLWAAIQPGFGSHKVAWVYDNRGNKVKVAYFGTTGEPVLLRANFHRVEMGYDDRGNGIEVAYFGADGEPVLYRESYHRMTQVNDVRGNSIELAYFGIDGEPVLNDDGVHHLTRTYSERGKVSEVRYFGIDGKAALYKSNYHRVVKGYDKHGNVSEKAYFGTDGEPILHPFFGYHRDSRGYDDRGNVVETAYFGTDNKPILHPDWGYHRSKVTYDEWGHSIERAYFGTDGKPILTANGVHRVTLLRTHLGEIIKTSYYDMEGRLVAETQ